MLKDGAASGDAPSVTKSRSALTAAKAKTSDKTKKKKVAPAPKRAAFQSTPSLDYLRANTPLQPGYSYFNILPGAGYDDPKPTITANYANYLTQLVQPNNASGPAGALPVQAVDPTAGSASISGISINLDTGNFNFTAPVFSLAGRAGLGASFAFNYGSKVWIKDPATNTMVFNADRGFPAPGWRGGFGALQVKDQSGPYLNSVTGKQSVIYLAPNGTRHDLALNPATGRFEAYDSSYLAFDAAQQILYSPNGAKMKFGEYSYDPNNLDYQALPIEIKDRNGNFITIAYRTLDNQKKVIDYFVDTAGRRIDFNYQNNRLTWIGQNRGGTWYYFVRIEYAPVTIQTNFAAPLTTDPPAINGTQVYLPVRLIYPTGIYHQFQYNGYGQITRIDKFLPILGGQGGGAAASTYFHFPPLSYSDCPSFTIRTEWAKSWQGGAGQSYQYQYNTSNGHEVTDPTGRRFRVKTEQTSSIAWIVTTSILPSGSSNWTKQDSVYYSQYDSALYRSNPCVTGRVTSIAASGTRTVFYSHTQLNGMWLETQKNEYDNSLAVYRRTVTEYTGYPAQGILALASQVSVYTGPSGLTLLSRTQTVFDETGAFTDSNGNAASYFIDATADGVIQHDNTSHGASFTQRGNLTSVVQSSVVNGAITGSRIVRRLSYDTNGNLRAETDAAGNRNRFSYADNYGNKPTGVGQTHAYLYTASNPNDSTGGTSGQNSFFRAGSQYDYFNGNVTKTFSLKPNSSAEEQVTLLAYDFADRLNQRTRPDGGYDLYTAWDNWLYQVTQTKIDQIGGQAQINFRFREFDGAGRAWRQASDHGDGIAGKYAGQQFIFDKTGGQSDASNQIAVNGDWQPTAEDVPPTGSGWVYANTSRDELDRLKLLTRTDGNVVQYDYSGCDCAGSATTTVTDERGCQVKTETDFLSRVWKVREINPNSSNYNQVTYTYDALDRLTQIDHADGTGRRCKRAASFTTVMAVCRAKPRLKPARPPTPTSRMIWLKPLPINSVLLLPTATTSVI